MIKKLAVVALCLAYVNPAFSGEYAFCMLVIRVAPAGELKKYTNKQIENGLCMTTKEVMTAIVKNDEAKQELCLNASQYLMEEFKRRWPNRDSKDVAGKC